MQACAFNTNCGDSPIDANDLASIFSILDVDEPILVTDG